jgi:hypothetical protein
MSGEQRRKKALVRKGDGMGIGDQIQKASEGFLSAMYASRRSNNQEFFRLKKEDVLF